MEIDLIQNQKAINRCHHCEWSYEADDSEFPSQFIFDLAYQVCENEIVLKSIEPQRVITTDLRGSRLFAHEFTDPERHTVSNWFDGRMRSVGETLIQSISAAIELDRQSRIAVTAETFRELKTARRSFVPHARRDLPGTFVSVATNHEMRRPN